VLLRFLSLKHRPHSLQFLALIRIDLGVSQLQIFQGFYNRRGHHHPSEPFVVRRYHVPGSARARSMDNHVFVGFYVFIPVLALLHIGRGEFPVLFRILQPVKEAPLLFLLGKIENLRTTIPLLE